MEVFIKVIGMKIKYLVMVNTIGTMEELIEVTGTTITCKDKEPINGQMVENTKVNI